MKKRNPRLDAVVREAQELAPLNAGEKKYPNA